MDWRILAGGRPLLQLSDQSTSERAVEDLRYQKWGISPDRPSRPAQATRWASRVMTERDRILRVVWGHGWGLLISLFGHEAVLPAHSQSPPVMARR